MNLHIAEGNLAQGIKRRDQARHERIERAADVKQALQRVTSR